MKLKKPITTWIKTNPFTTGLIALALAAGLWYFASSFTSGVRHLLENRAADKLEQQANDAQDKAAQKLNEAHQVATDRAVEDLNRARAITPEIERTARAVNETRESARRARTNYENARTKPDLLNDPDTAALHDRNCADLNQLYPGEQRPICDR